MEAYTPDNTTQWTATALETRVSELRRIHAARTEAEALRITRHAIRRWTAPARWRVVHPNTVTRRTTRAVAE